MRRIQHVVAPVGPVSIGTGLARTGLARTGLARTGLAWTGLAWTGLAWTGLAWTGLTALALVAITSGCSVDFVTGNEFACVGEGFRSTCLTGYVCNVGKCVREGEYQPPGVDTGPQDTVGPRDVPADVPDVFVPPDIPPDVPPLPKPGDPCEADADCDLQQTGLFCADEKVCCNSSCADECKTCLSDAQDPEHPEDPLATLLGQCVPVDAGAPCTGGGTGDAACNACNGNGQCLPTAGERCGNCQACAVPGGGGAAVCDPVAAGTDPFEDCGDRLTCGAACGLDGQCDIEAAAPQNGVRCETCKECQNGACVPRLAGAEDDVCGDPSCGGVCAAGGSCSTDFRPPDTTCEICHQCDAEGHCLPVREGTEDEGCADENPCGRTRFCDAEGACAIQPIGHVCSTQTCAGITKTTHACDDNQECIATDAACTPYTCDPQTAECRTRCHSNAPCDQGFFCSAGLCQGTGQPGDQCIENIQCASSHCVDGVCCDTACAGPCQVCDGVAGLAEPGTCTVPVGQNPLATRGGPQDGERDCDGQVDACDGVCVQTEAGAGACDYAVTTEDSCGTCKWCSPSGSGDCVNRPTDPRYYGDCAGDEVCGGYCEAGSCVFEKAVGAACGDGPCSVCIADRTCGLAAAGTDPKGLCPGDARCGGGCTEGGQCGTFAGDGALCGEGNTPCFWCQSGDCVLIQRDQTPQTLCGGGDDLCRARCTAAGQCGPAVPSGAPCSQTCHRCNGSGLCAFAFLDPATEPADECPGDVSCGTHCDLDLGACGSPQPLESVCGASDGCSVCQDVPDRGRQCLPRTDTPAGVCVREDGHTDCVGRCGSFGVCEWPGQEEPCGECHRCNGDGYCEQAAGEQVSAEDCTPDDAACRGQCLGGVCGYAASDRHVCGGVGALCRWCRAGLCEFIVNGGDPLGQCNPVDHEICGETCDGGGACAPAPGPTHPDGPIECGEPCHWCDGGACAPIGQSIDAIIEEPFGRCQADQVCSAGECSTCGNGVLEAGEICDPNDPEHPCEGVCSSPDPCVLAMAFDCRCVEVPVVEPDDGTDGCCPPIAERGLDADCMRWDTPLALNPDPLQPFTFAHLPAVDAATGTLYIGGRDQTQPTPRPRIFAISPDGEVLWTASTASNPDFASVATSSPVLAGTHLYFGRSTWLVAIDVTAETPVATEIVNLNSLIKEPPVVSRSGLLIVGTQDGTIRGINPFTGVAEWTYVTGAGLLTGPGTQSGYYVYWGAGATLHVINTATPPTAPGSSPCFTPPTNLASGGVGLGGRVGDGAAGSVYLADDNGTVYVLFAAGTAGVGCTPLNSDTTTVGGSVDATPVTLSDGSVVVGGHDPDLNPDPAVGVYAFLGNLTDVEWAEGLGRHARYTPVIGKGPEGELVYVGLRQIAGVRILAIQPGLGGATQGLVWGHDYQVPGAPSAYVTSALAMGVDGTIYFRTSDGSLNAVVTNSTDGLSNRGWPKRYGDYANTGNAP